MGKPAAMLVRGAENRRDIWASREEAYKVLKSRPAWKAWDDRVLRQFVVCLVLMLLPKRKPPLTISRKLGCDPSLPLTIQIKPKA